MKFSQKKTCNRCKCLDACDYRCELGYKIKTGKDYYGIVLEFIPLEPCWKPVTNSQWCEAHDLAGPCAIKS